MVPVDENILQLFRVVAKGVRHEHYNHVKKKRRLYRQLVAGVGTDKLLKQFVRRESEELFEQRVQLTQHITKSVCKGLFDVFYKVPRSNSGRRLLTYRKHKKSDEKRKEVEGILENFYGAQSFDDYMSSRYIDIGKTDPNTFLVFVWDEFDETKELLQTRPLEITARAALDFKYENNVLKYLIFEQPHEYELININKFDQDSLDKSKQIKEGKKYSLYTENQIFQLFQVDEKQLASGSFISAAGVQKEGVIVKGTKRENVEGKLKITKTNFVKLGKEFYEYIAYEPHNLGMVNAFRIGYNPDMENDGATMVNSLDCIESFLLKTVKSNSELDLVASLLAMPQQIGYGQACPDQKCYKGYEGRTEKVCKTCRGTGLKRTSPSAQDAIIIEMPKDKDRMIPLKEMLTYLHPEVAIIQWQEQFIDSLITKCKTFMFNADIFTRSQVAETAHGKQLDHQNVYDTLYPFALKWGKDWACGVKIAAGLADRGEDLLCSYTFGKDFKLKTLDTLIADLERANKIGDATLVRHFRDDIAQIIFAEKPLEKQRYELKELFNPFAGKSEKEIMFLMASNLVSIRQKTLHANYGTIFDELEIEYAQKNGKNFYELDRIKMREEIYKKVDEIVKEIDEEEPEPELGL